MHHNLHEFLNHTEGIGYLLSLVILLVFIALWRFVTERET